MSEKQEYTYTTVRIDVETSFLLDCLAAAGGEWKGDVIKRLVIAAIENDPQAKGIRERRQAAADGFPF